MYSSTISARIKFSVISVVRLVLRAHKQVRLGVQGRGAYMTLFRQRHQHIVCFSLVFVLFLVVTVGLTTMGGTVAAAGEEETRGFLITGSANAFHYGGC